MDFAEDLLRSPGRPGCRLFVLSADADHLRAMYEVLPSGLLGARDRALIGLGFSGAFRRSELVALDVGDLSFVRRGLEVRVRRSKTDQEGHGFIKNIARGNDPTTCTVRAVRDWLELAGIVDGPCSAPSTDMAT